MEKTTRYKGLIDYDATAQRIWDEKGWNIAVWASRSGFPTNVPSVQMVFRQSYKSPGGRLPQRVVAELRKQELAVDWQEETDQLAA